MSRKTIPVYQQLALALLGLTAATRANNQFGINFQNEVIRLVMRTAPSGSGFDSGTGFLEEESNDGRLVFLTDFHHMDDNWTYDGWTSHRVVVRPSLAFGIELHVTGGKNRNKVNDYIHEVFRGWLLEEVDQIKLYEEARGELSA